MSKVTWLTPYLDEWKEWIKGDLPAGKAAKYLAPIRKELGEEETLFRWMVYCRSQAPQFASPARFAETHGQYASTYKPPPPETVGPRPLTMGRVI